MGYRAFNDKTTFSDAVDSVTYTVEALDAYPDADIKAFAAPLNKLLDQEDALLLAQRKVRRATTRANARVRAADAIADDHLRDFAKDVLGAVRQNRSDPLFQDLFPSTPTDIIALSLLPEVEELTRMLEVLDRKSTPAALRKSWHKTLTDDVTLGNAALGERKAALTATTEASAAMVRWIELADRARRAIDGALTKHAADHDLPSDLNDRFFPGAPAKKAPRKKGDGTPPAPGSPA